MNESQLTIDSLLREHARTKPHAIAYYFLSDGESKEEKITYGELDQKASKIATTLQTTAKKSSLALLLFPSGLEFISAFFGCLYAGVIAVPTPIPKKIRTYSRLANILSDTQADFVLTDHETYAELKKHPLFATKTTVTWIVIDIPLKNPMMFEKKHDQSLAFLQYTSGSTSNPKGVMISHRNIMANMEMIKDAFGHDDTTIFMGWLPLFHDMGLVGNILQPMYLGIPSVLMSPVAFLQKPLRWLEAISKYRATTSGAPNFAYDLCVDKIRKEEIQKLDLSCWKLAFNGAEPIHPKTLFRFAEAFSPVGFQLNSFYPCYGMAETTVFVTGNPPSKPLDLLKIDKKTLEEKHLSIPSTEKSSGIMLAGTGISWGHEKVLIVNPDSKKICQPNQVGEIWVQGAHVASGYWNQPELSKLTFQATVEGEEGYFLRTGDLGFLSSESNLFITGRLKDLMIIRGRNIYPQDVELIVEECDPALRSHGTAAFSIERENQEALIIVSEIEREKIRHLEPEKLKIKIRQTLATEFQVAPIAIILIKPGTLPKTSSGKVQRSLCKKLFLEESLDVITIQKFEDEIASPVLSNSLSKNANILRNKLANILHITPKQITSYDPLTSFGLDSLGAIAIQVFVKEEWNILIEIEALLDNLSLDLLLKKIEKSEKKEESYPSTFASSAKNYPLSYQQKGIWVDSQIAENSYTYNLSKAIEILSQVDSKKIEYALICLVERHQQLRASFLPTEETQHINSSFETFFNEKNLFEQELFSFLEKESLRPFHLGKNSLFRVWLLKTENGRSILFFIVHHLIADLWSFGIFLKEFLEIYNSLIANEIPLLPSPKKEYADFVTLQKSSLEKENVHHAIDYWKQKPFSYFHLPTDFRPTTPKTAEGSHLIFELSTSQSEQLRQFASANHTTPYIVLMATYFLLMSKWGGQKELCLGTTSHGRTDPDFYSCFGCFANPVPIHLSLVPYLSFEAVVERLKGLILEAFGPHHLPFYYLLNELRIPRNLETFPLFQTMFVFQQVPTLPKELHELVIPTSQKNPPIQYEHLTLSSLFFQAPISPFDLTLFMNENGTNFFGCFEYRKDLFKEETISALKIEFEEILSFCLSKPTSSIGLLHVKKQKPLPLPFKDPETLIQRFEKITSENPDSIALTYQEEQMTYQQLDHLSNQCARWLIRKGMKPDDIVSLLLPHSFEIVIAILGILKIGAAFLPINPKTPLKRIESLITDSQSSLMLSLENFSLKEIREESCAALPFIGSSDSIAYLMYTSGSTGLPKGVAISHASLLNYLNAIAKHYHLEGTLHFPLHSSLAFDLTLTSLFFPLLSGNTVHIFSSSEETSSVLEKIFQHPLLTHIKLTPAHLKIACDISIPLTSKISQLIVGGEQLSLQLTEKIYKKFPHSIEIINEYGPTEATIGCVYFTYPTVPVDTAVLPIGVPILNTWTYLMDEFLEEVTGQHSGELYLGGLDLALGYWQHPELTAQKFLPDPKVVGGRVYKSGDQAKYLDSRILLCLGRIDRQVKIRGHRIELTEIENLVENFPGIKECICALKPFSGDDQSEILCAYYIPESNEISGQALQVYLEQLLPTYMVPSVFILCESIPLTPNGKIDIEALPKPTAWMKARRTLVPPQTPLQDQLTSLWAQTLSISKSDLGIQDSFFELGGDSIKAIQLVSRCRSNNINFSVSDLFQFSTIEQLSTQIENSLKSNHKKIQTNVIGKIPLSPIQKWFLNHFDEYKHHYNQAILLHRKEGFNFNWVESIFKEIINRHDHLRTIFPDLISGVIQSQDVQTFALHATDYRNERNWNQLMEEKIQFLQTQCDIIKGPLIQLGIFETPQGGYLCMIIHHLLVDGVSWRVILDDFNCAYSQLSLGKNIQLLESTDSYASWIDNNENHLLPIPKSDQNFKVSNQKEMTLHFSFEKTQDLLLNVHRAYHTQVQDILLVALSTSFYHVLDQQEIMLHVEHHGRTSKNLDLTRTVGWFTALNPIHLKMKNPSNLPYTIKSIKEDSKFPLPMLPHPTVVFNYLGIFTSSDYDSFSFQPILKGLTHAAASSPYNLQINIFILDHKLKCQFVFDEEIYPLSIREKLLSSFEEELTKTIHHCLEKKSEEFTPSDFGLIKFNLEDWERSLYQITAVTGQNAENIAKILPLSSLQEGLIYHSLKERDKTAYIEQAVLHFEGEIDPSILEKSIQQLIANYESLRAAFFYDAFDSPKQIIFKHRPAPFEIQTLQGEDEDFFVSEYLKKDKEKSFDIKNDPLFRTALLKLKEGKFTLIWSFHHLILDGWSLSILFRSFLQNLQALYRGEALPKITSQSITPYLEQQAAPSEASLLVYWENLIGDYREQTSLPKIERIQTKKNSILKTSSIIDQEKMSQLSQLGQKLNVTLNTIFQAIWSLLLSHYTQRNDLVFGTIVSGRNPEIPNIDNLVGLFIQTIPVRSKIHPEMKFSDLADFVQKQNIESSKHASLSLSKIQGFSPLKHHLIEHLFVFENYPFAGHVEELVNQCHLPFQLKSALLCEETHYDFLISFFPAETMTIEIQYNESLYDRNFIAAIFTHFDRVIYSICTHPEILLGEISLCSQKESSYFNAITPLVFPEQPLSDLFEAQAEKTPDSIAIVHGSGQLTYRKLNEEADRLASYLTSLGIGPEKGVALFFDRSPDMLIAWLAVLKSGGFYVPFESSAAPERLSNIIQEMGITVLLTHSPLSKELPKIDCKIIEVDGYNWKDCDQCDYRSIVKDPLQLAYVLFTSGSTGKPKGIAMTHSAVCNHLSWIVKHFDLNTQDRMLQLTAFSFDVALCEFYALFVGASLVLAPKNSNRDVNELLNIIDNERITFLQLVPSLFEVLLDKETFQRIASLRQVLCGADVLKKDHLDKWLSDCSIPLTNLYGLTETCIDATYYDCDSQKLTSSVPIGKPLFNVESYVLSKHLNLLPHEVPGELHLGGLCLARGYYGLAELTALKFTPHPFKKGMRLFNTSDQVILKTDENLYYIGRSDTQVKIRGFRIEIGEIEATLLSYPGLEKCHVRVSGKDAEKFLVAYFISQRPIEVFQLKEFLAKKIPYYMVPNHFIRLDLFPLTPHGKIDAQALPLPQADSGREALLPRGEIEQKLETLWRDVLKIPVDPISTDRNFFDLGGNSMNLMQLHTGLGKLFPKKIAMEQLFQYTTIQSLSKYFNDNNLEISNLNKLLQRAEKRHQRRERK